MKKPHSIAEWGFLLSVLAKDSREAGLQFLVQFERHTRLDVKTGALVG
ncbi:hypothetical protein [Hymenobacter sp. YC55]|nr:hypothetical protein [Hymenobacter sp. YC55]